MIEADSLPEATMRLEAYSVGDYGNRVRVYRLEPGGAFYSEIGGQQKVVRLPDRRRILNAKDARAWARREHQERTDGKAAGMTLASVFALYLTHRTPVKATAQGRKDDQRRVQMWQRFLGVTRDVEQIERGDIERFVRQRGYRVIDSWGRLGNPGGNPRSLAGSTPATPARPPTVRPRTVQAEIQWLRGVLRWHLGDRCPVRSWPVREIARELNTTAEPRQPVATQDRYEAIMKYLGGLTQSSEPMERSGARVTPATPDHYGYLPDLLPIVNATGHRLSEILSLEWRDIDLDAKPYGTIRWRWDATGNKARIERVVPLNPAARAAIDRIKRSRPGVGAALLFPALRSKPSKPVPTHRSVADKWLRQAEKHVGLQPLPGSLWHQYRRKWATERKHLPDADVAHAGGWKNARTLRAVYQQPDAEGVLRVVLDATELREEKA